MGVTIERTGFSGMTMPEIMTGTAYMEEALAHTYIITPPEGVTYTGQVLAHVLRADDTAIAVDGTIDAQGRAVVTLIADCYHVAGRLQVAIYLTASDDSGVPSECIYACVTAIYRTIGSVELDSGSEIPTLAQLEAAYQACVTATADARAAADNAVIYSAAQTLDAAQQAQARGNIAAADAKTDGAMHSLADYGSPATSATVVYGGVTATKTGMCLTLNGDTTSSTACFRLSGEIIGIEDVNAKAQNNGTLVLESDHIYRLSARLISGAVTGTVYAQSFNSGAFTFTSNYVASDDSAHFVRYLFGNDQAVTVWFRAVQGASFENAEYLVTLEDATDEMLSKAQASGYYHIKAREFDLVPNGMDNAGEIAADNIYRYSTRRLIPADAIYSIQSASTLEVAVYGFSRAMEPLGFWDGTSAFSTSTATYLQGGKGFLLAKHKDYANIGYLRFSVKRPGSATAFTDISQTDDLIIIGKHPRWYDSKTWVAIGDSITYGTYSYGSGSIARDPQGSYAYLASKRVGYRFVNAAVPNLGFTVDATDTSFPYRTLPDVLANTDFTNASIVTVALGTNDYGRDGTLGTLSDTSAVNSIYGRAKLIIETVQTQAPGARLIFVTPIPRETAGTANGRYDMTVRNGSGFSLSAVRTAILELCTLYGLECINWTDSCPINYFNCATYQLDHLHPTKAGHFLLGEAFAAKVIGINDSTSAYATEHGATIAISGATPTIAAVSGMRYECGTVTELSFTPSSSGLCEVVFASGSTPTVLTLPSTVRMPDWWTGVEANRTYDLMILNGTLAGVMSWAT